jgi:hypothetical protein
MHTLRKLAAAGIGVIMAALLIAAAVMTTPAKANPAGPTVPRSHAKAIYIQHPLFPERVNIGENWCIGNSNDCLNAWNGGPWVKIYTGGPTTNGLFAPTTDSQDRYAYLLFGNFGSPWSSHCIGDAYNDPNDARASLNPCPGALGNDPSGDGWGTHLVEDHTNCASGYYGWYDSHWGGWIGPVANYTNGSQIYLNKQNPYCYKIR